MKRFLNEFIAFCNLADITPSEDEIDTYLRKENVEDKEVLRNFLIRFCFYHWEHRNNDKYLETILR